MKVHKDYHEVFCKELTLLLKKREHSIFQVMDLLELNEIGNKLVGTIGDAGLSIEEAKRLTIGVELVGIYNFPTYLNQNWLESG